MKRIMVAGWETANDKYDDYLRVLKELGADAFLSLNPEDILNCDGIVLPGSSQDINPKLWGEKDICSNDINDDLDEVQSKILDIAIDKWKPVLGICRGMQMINVYFGGTLIQHLQCAGEHQKEIPEKYHSVLHLKGGFMELLIGEQTMVNTHHHQGVGNIGRRLEVASVWNDGEDGVVEAFRHRFYPILGVQWHPEKMYLYGDEKAKADAEKVLRYFLELEASDND